MKNLTCLCPKILNNFNGGNFMTAKEYKQKMLIDAFDKRLELTNPTSHTECACADCQEALVFALEINGQVISIGLNTILECLKIAEDEGYIEQKYIRKLV